MAERSATPATCPTAGPDGAAAGPARLPRQRRGTTPQMHGRYPDYDVLDDAGHWDAVDPRGRARPRSSTSRPLRFFDREPSARRLRAFCDVVLAQDAEPRDPGRSSFVDAKLHDGRLDGYRYADMPDDRETWRLVAARARRGRARPRRASFAAAPTSRRSATIVGAFADGRAWPAAPGTSCSTSHGRGRVVMRAVLAAFYSHPWAWNEIGFGGPAYPRGYMRLGAGQPSASRARRREALRRSIRSQDVERRGLR